MACRLGPDVDGADNAAAGVDGCRGGWLAVTGSHRHWQGQVHPHLADALPARATVAIDMPIGLLDKPRPGGRDCDRLARRALGRRGCTVFSPPARSGLRASGPGRGLSLQAWHLLPRIREADHVARDTARPGGEARAGRARLVETHPELAFLARAGRPLAPKRSLGGRRQRMQILEGCGFDDVAAGVRQLRARQSREVAADDVLDALVLLDVALGIERQATRTLPVQPPRDRHRLAMRIAY